MSGDLTGEFGRNVFNEATMRECLPKNVFKSLKRTLDGEQPLDPVTAKAIGAFQVGVAQLRALHAARAAHTV